MPYASPLAAPEILGNACRALDPAFDTAGELSVSIVGAQRENHPRVVSFALIDRNEPAEAPRARQRRLAHRSIMKKRLELSLRADRRQPLAHPTLHDLSRRIRKETTYLRGVVARPGLITENHARHIQPQSRPIIEPNGREIGAWLRGRAGCHDRQESGDQRGVDQETASALHTLPSKGSQARFGDRINPTPRQARTPTSSGVWGGQPSPFP